MTEINLDKQLCLEVAATIKKSETPEDAGNIHRSLLYLKNNLDAFTDEEIAEALKNQYFLKRSGGDFGVNIMQRCVDHGKSFPLILPSWAEISKKKTLIKNYIEIIHNENNKEQLEFFFDKLNNETVQFINENNSQSAYFYLYEKVIEKTLNSFREYQKDTSIAPNVSKIVKNIFMMESPSLILYFKDKYPKEYTEVLSTPVIDNTESLNFAQYILLNRHYPSLHSIHDIFSSHKELLTKPMKTKIKVYEKEISIFEYGLVNSNFYPFMPFTLNDSLDEENKEQIVAGAFFLLQHKYKTSNQASLNSLKLVGYENVFNLWYPKIIEQATDEQLNIYTERIIKGNENNEEFVREINSLKLKAELNRDLSENNAGTKPRIKL